MVGCTETVRRVITAVWQSSKVVDEEQESKLDLDCNDNTHIRDDGQQCATVCNYR